MNGNRQEVINAIIDGMKSEAIESVKGWDLDRDCSFEAHNLWSGIRNDWSFESEWTLLKSKRHLAPQVALFKVLAECDDDCVDICFQDGTFLSFFDAELVIDKVKSWDKEEFIFN